MRKYRLRVSIRTLLAIVSAVAVILAAISEVWNHSRCDELTSKVMSYYMAANWHHREAICCRTMTSPYPVAERSKANRGYYPGTLPGSVTTWQEEAAFRETWGGKLEAKADDTLRRSEEVYDKLLFR
jgi:hypothetical protein